jgi:uncharacterized membrane protein YdbT with pleckstrin-like domain
MPDTPAPSPSSAAESMLWKGHSSQWVHIGFYLICIVIAAACLAGIPFSGGLSAIGLVVPLLGWIIRWWITRSTSYELTTQRFKIRRGILNRKLDELELFRVRDYSMEQPFFLRLFHLGNITLMTSDATSPTVVLRAIHDIEDVHEKLRTAVQNERDRRRVRPLDMVDGDDNDLG